MEIKGKVHCFFEQSGTFKNEFIKLGIPAEDYDIQNNFGQTDHVIDLFHEIESAYEGGVSVFDNITKDDLIVAFYPCIYFSCVSSMWFSLTQRDYKNWPYKNIIDNMNERADKRNEFFKRLNKFVCVCLENKIRMILENPWSENHFFKFGFLKPPTVIDTDRTRRGDFRIKPTAYWFWNCTNENGFTNQQYKGEILIHDKLKKGKEKGVCSEERSMIHPDYARNWICDFVIGKKQNIGQLSLF